jgi:hypothetical protein
VKAAGIEPAALRDDSVHNTTIFPTEPQQIKTFEETATLVGVHQQPISEHQDNIFLHEKCVICVSHIPDDLLTVIRTWECLPTTVKAGIVAMVKAACPA